MKLKKRILSLLLCGAMLFSLCSQSVLAEENGQAGGVTIGTSGLCEHHPEHNADCGYTEGTAGTPCVHEHTADCYEEVTNCVHEHDEDCYPEESVSGNEATPSGAQKREPENCPHICDEKSGCITKELNCQHEHDDGCGYSPATAGTPCGYVCELCGSEDSEKLATPSNAEAVTVASVQAMINALPSAEAITEENAEEVKAQLEAIDEAKEKLSDEEIDELDMTRYTEAAAALGAMAAPMLLANDSPDEQFSLTPGGTYYFDLSGASIPGTANSGNSYGAASLPDTSLHYVPFTYAGTIEAYKLTSAMATTEEYAEQNKYPHSLFVADYAVTHTISWGDLNTKGLIFGKNYASGGVDYTLRAPSVGSKSTGSGASQRIVPQSNEWDTMLNKNSGYIQNWNEMYSWGQDTVSVDASSRAVRGCYSARLWISCYAANSVPYVGFRPVLEVPNSDTLDSGGLKAVTLDLGGGKLGGSSDAIHIIVKNGSAFTAPASDGLTRPDGNTGSYFMWLDGNGKSYEPGDSVPADVTELTVQWTAPTYTVTLHANGGTINNGNVTEYTYGVGATLPTADDMTYTGHTFKGWYANENLTGSPVTAIGGTETGNKEYWAKWEANTYTVTLNTNGGTINSGNVTGYTYGVGATLPTADDMTYTGYTFKGWYDNEGLTGFPVTAISDTETGNKEYWAKWEANAYTVTLNTNGGTINNGNVTEYTYGVGATLPTDVTRTGYTFKGWYDNENLTGSPVTAIGGTEMGNKEYWAKWEANTYTVTFYPNGGSVNPVAATTDSSGKLSSLPTPTRGGNYRFDGWYTEQTGGIKVTLNQVYTADTTLYAYWIYTSGSSSSEDRDDPSGNAFITDRPNKDNPTTPTTAKSNSVKVDSKGNAVITRSIVADVISVAQSDSIKHGNTKNGIAVVVPVEISKALAGVQITLKADALDKLVSSGVKRFTIDTDSMADFGFMLDTLKELNRQTTGDLILKMKKTAVTSQEVETAIGNRPVYDITLWEVKNGKETVVNLSGKTVSIAIPYTPAKNEKPGNLYAVYVDENGNVQWISKSSYNMDQKAVIFVAEHFSIYGIGYKNQIPAFTDVNNHWAKDNMLFVVSRGLLSGTSATTFSPNTGMTRGMFVTALGRLAGVDPTDYQARMFTDVKEDAYYAMSTGRQRLALSVERQILLSPRIPTSTASRWRSL